MDREAVIDAAKEGVKAALEKYHICRYGVGPEEVGHMVGMVKDLGDGDYAKGVEQIRTNHKLMMKWGERLEDAAKIVARGIIMALVAAILGILWLGFKLKIGGN